MAFTFTSSQYRFPGAWTTAEKVHATTILKLGVQTRAKASDIMRMYFKAGISYRKTNMLQDISRAQSIEQARTVSAYKRAEKWFEQSEKVRLQTTGMSRKQSADFMDRWKIESWKSIEEAELASRMEIEGGCPSPPC